MHHELTSIALNVSFDTGIVSADFDISLSAGQLRRQIPMRTTAVFVVGMRRVGKLCDE